MADRDIRELQDKVGRLEEVVERVTAQRPKVPKIARLPAAATTADIIDKINALLDRLQE